VGLFDFIKGELIDIIEWVDDSTDQMVYRFPTRDKEIKMGAQLTVRPAQVAIFINEGQIADVFQPGRYKLSTENMPVLTTLKSWKYGFESPFKSEVYFVNTKQFTNQKWGTSNPIMMRDSEFGVLRLRAYGIFSFKVEDPVVFLNELFGSNQLFTTDNISEHLKKLLVSGLSDLLAESKIAAIDLAMYYDELGKMALDKMDEKFLSLGLTIKSFIIENISLPEEVEKAMDKRTSMGVIGNLNQYAKFQAAEAITDAAQNEGGGLASAGVGFGAGAALGNMFGNAFKDQETPAPSEEKSQTMIICQKCQSKVPATHKFCSSCGTSIQPKKQTCIKCGTDLPENAKFCLECGSSQEQDIICSSCGKKLKPGAKFCDECGQKVE